MSSTYFQPPLASQAPEQAHGWHHRCRTAEATLARQVDAGVVPDAETIAHFQTYVNGDITLGQAIGRVLDKLARTGYHSSS
ncbi:MAG: hypothetical protein ACRYFV_11805 [Janthinobacterium lividum]